MDESSGGDLAKRFYPDLAEICITADPHVLREIADFLHDAADEIEEDFEACQSEAGGHGSGHVHWRGGTSPDIIVAWDFYADIENEQPPRAPEPSTISEG